MAEETTFEDKITFDPAPQATAATLTDPTETFNQASNRIEEAGTGALAGIRDAQPGDVSYGGTDAQKIKDEARIDQGSSYITPQATVSGQLQSLLDANGQYMQNAERRAKEQAASLGLLGSSMAVGATQRAALESAMPIAQQDADTYAKAALQEQQTYNEVSRMKAESDLSAAAREHTFDIDVSKGKLQATINQLSQNAEMQGNMAMEGAIGQMSAQWDSEVKTTLSNLDAQLQTQVNNNQITAAQKQWASETSSQVMAAAYGTINDLLVNSEFMASYADNPDGLAKVFNNFIGFGKDQVAFIGGTAGLEASYNDPNTGWLSYIGTWV